MGMLTMVMPMGLALVLRVGHPHMRLGTKQHSVRAQAIRMAGAMDTMVMAVTQTRTLGMAMEA